MPNKIQIIYDDITKVRSVSPIGSLVQGADNFDVVSCFVPKAVLERYGTPPSLRGSLWIRRPNTTDLDQGEAVMLPLPNQDLSKYGQLFSEDEEYRVDFLLPISVLRYSGRIECSLALNLVTEIKNEEGELDGSNYYTQVASFLKFAIDVRSSAIGRPLEITEEDQDFFVIVMAKIADIEARLEGADFTEVIERIDNIENSQSVQDAAISTLKSKLNGYSYNPTTHILAFYDFNNNLIGSIDFPIEQLIKGITLDGNDLVLTYQGGDVRISLGNLLVGMASQTWVNDNFYTRTEIDNLIGNSNYNLGIFPNYASVQSYIADLLLDPAALGDWPLFTYFTITGANNSTNTHFLFQTRSQLVVLTGVFSLTFTLFNSLDNERLEASRKWVLNLNDSTWTEDFIDPSVSEAPRDGKQYARQNGDWSEIVASPGGGGGPNVVQSTGSSTTDVMSQDATTKAVNGRAPTNHAASLNTYGEATELNYGHTRITAQVASTGFTSSMNAGNYALVHFRTASSTQNPTLIALTGRPGSYVCYHPTAGYDIGFTDAAKPANFPATPSIEVQVTTYTAGNYMTGTAMSRQVITIPKSHRRWERINVGTGTPAQLGDRPWKSYDPTEPDGWIYNQTLHLDPDNYARAKLFAFGGIEEGIIKLEDIWLPGDSYSNNIKGSYMLSLYFVTDGPRVEISDYSYASYFQVEDQTSIVIVYNAVTDSTTIFNKTLEVQYIKFAGPPYFEAFDSVEINGEIFYRISIHVDI